MKHRKETLAKIKDERRNGQAVSQVERLRLAMSDLADAEMEIGADAEAHARKLVFVAYLLVWHETRDDLGEFGGWKWDGSAVRIIAESAEEADRLEKLPPGRDRVLFLWFGFDKRDVDHAAGPLNEFASKLAQAIPLLPALPRPRNGKPNEAYNEEFRQIGEELLETQRQITAVPVIGGETIPAMPTRDDDNAMLSPADLAKKFQLPLDSTKKALTRWRERNAGGDGYVENRDARRTDPQFLYKLGMVSPTLQRLASLRTRREGGGRKLPATGNISSHKRPVKK